MYVVKFRQFYLIRSRDPVHEKNGEKKNESVEEERIEEFKILKYFGKLRDIKNK
jgi:hypothetical protein